MVQAQEQCKNSGPNTRGLKPFRPGQSGNPKGRPKGSGKLKTQFMKILAEAAPGSDSKTLWQVFVRSQIARGIKGNAAAAGKVWDYAVGKPKDEDGALCSAENPLHTKDMTMDVNLAEHMPDRDIEDLELDRKH